MITLPGKNPRVCVRAFALLLALAALFVPARAFAFCGFYVSGADTKLTNDATRVVLMRDGQRTVLSMQNSYKGPLAAFAMVVPVPVVLQKENVKVLKHDAFERIDDLSAPRLVEYWEEDPCAQPNYPSAMGGLRSIGGSGGLGGIGSGSARDLGVKIEAQFEVGEYEIVILSAKDSTGLDTWLRQENYKIPDGAEPYLRPYVQSGSKFFVAKVNPQKVTFTNGRAELSPLRFHYDSPDFNLPVRLGLLNSAGKQDLLVFILAPNRRYQVANYKNVTIPTNLDVADATRAHFSAFYASLFDSVVEKNQSPVVTEYAWDSASCDPCPVPALANDELATFGGNVIPSATFGIPGSARPTSTVAQGPTTSDVPVNGADRVLAGFRPRTRACYNQALAQDPTQSGTALLTIVIAPNGEASSAQLAPQRGASLSPNLISCITRAARNLQFDAPGGSGTKLTQPFTFSSDAPAAGQPPKPVLTSLPSFTLTRLHARYSKDALGQDLVFREAAAIEGGREGYATGAANTEAHPASTNNFQARYVIRHAWSGPIACAHPERGKWGGPPDGRSSPVAPARKLATVSRDVTFTTFVAKGSLGALLGTTLENPPIPDAGPPPAPPPIATDAATPPSASAPIATPDLDAGGAPAGAGVEPKRGCGCAVVGDAGAEKIGFTALLFGAIALVWRRRRRG